MPLRPLPLALALGVFLSPALAGDWPRWRGANGDGHVTGADARLEALPAEAKAKWRFKLGDGHGSPVVAQGRAYILDKQEKDEVLVALDAASGQPLWKKTIYLGNDDNQGKGPRGTPLVDGDRVYVQTMRGEFQCLAVADGALRWRKNFVDDFGAVFLGEISNQKSIGATRHGNNGSPLIDGDHIIVQAGGLSGASVVCLDKRTGATIWKSQDDPAGYAAAIIAELAGVRQVVVYTALGVIGLDPRDGKLLWRFPISTTWARHATTPVVVGDIVTVSSHQHGMFGLRVSRDGAGQKVEKAWLTKEAAINFASPVAVGDHVYGLGPAKNLLCVDVRTGKIAWSQDGYFAGNAGQSHAGLLVLGKNILCLTDRGELVLFAADPAAFRQVNPGGRIQACGQTWCNPAYADGVAYLRDKKELLALPLR